MEGRSFNWSRTKLPPIGPPSNRNLPPLNDNSDGKRDSGSGLQLPSPLDHRRERSSCATGGRKSRCHESPVGRQSRCHESPGGRQSRCHESHSTEAGLDRKVSSSSMLDAIDCPAPERKHNSLAPLFLQGQHGPVREEKDSTPRPGHSLPGLTTGRLRTQPLPRTGNAGEAFFIPIAEDTMADDKEGIDPITSKYELARINVTNRLVCSNESNSPSRTSKLVKKLELQMEEAEKRHRHSISSIAEKAKKSVKRMNDARTRRTEKYQVLSDSVIKKQKKAAEYLEGQGQKMTKKKMERHEHRTAVQKIRAKRRRGQDAAVSSSLSFTSPEHIQGTPSAASPYSCLDDDSSQSPMAVDSPF